MVLIGSHKGDYFLVSEMYNRQVENQKCSRTMKIDMASNMVGPHDTKYLECLILLAPAENYLGFKVRRILII